jgi:transcriptional regulator
VSVSFKAPRQAMAPPQTPLARIPRAGENMEQPVNTPSPPASFGVLLRARRHRACLSQEELAARAGLSERTVRNLEAGQVRSPRPATVRLLAGALQLSEPERESWLEAARGGLPGAAAQARAGQAGRDDGTRHGGPLADAGGRELAQLRRETRRLREAVQVLKRAAAVFAAAAPHRLPAGPRISQIQQRETTMHTFPEYAPRRDAQAGELVRRHPFAAVVSTGHGVPVASHVPVITPSSQQLREGGTLWGHMARANPQWRTFEAARPVLVIFTGAHAYVSAALYERVPAVPTWNYSAVHVTALPQVLPQGEPTMRVLTQTVQALEALRETPWDMSASLGRFHHIADGVVAFSLRITAVQAVFKLSQDTPDELWQRVHHGLAADPVSAQVAHDMAHFR